MKKIGITGNIGSGKSMVCSIFEILEVPVFYADVEAKKLYEKPEIIAMMVKHFGKSIYHSDRTINTAALAKKLFNQNDNLDFVNSILHPAVHHRFEEWTTNFKSASYILYEAAILYETGYYKDFDAIILVTAPEELRIERILQRDKLSLKEIKSRMARQWSEDKKISRADFIIQNDGTQHLIPQILKLHRTLIK